MEVERVLERCSSQGRQVGYTCPQSFLFNFRQTQDPFISACLSPCIWRASCSLTCHHFGAGGGWFAAPTGSFIILSFRCSRVFLSRSSFVRSFTTVQSHLNAKRKNQRVPRNLFPSPEKGRKGEGEFSRVIELLRVLDEIRARFLTRVTVDGRISRSTNSFVFVRAKRNKKNFARGGNVWKFFEAVVA